MKFQVKQHTRSFFVQGRYYGLTGHLSKEKEYLQFIEPSWLGLISTFVILYGVESKNLDQEAWVQILTVTYEVYDFG